MHPHRPPAPQQLPLVTLPPPTEAEVRDEAERIRLSRAYLRRRYRSGDELLADPVLGRSFLICARRALLARRDAP